ncbi:MAG: PAS domain S-box protein [Mariprofundaceae bacterium]|nr:PAS domain S-box protein [Mariprofundaceae bacterium]
MTGDVSTGKREGSEPFLKAITVSYLLATCMLAAVAIGSYIILQGYTKAEATSAAQINSSGRQRMLANRVVMSGYRLVQRSEHAYPSDMVEAARLDLLAAADRLQQSHRHLVDGNRAMNLPGSFSDDIRSIYFDGPDSLDSQIQAFVARARALASLPEPEITHDNEHLRYLGAAVEGALLARLKMLVGQYQEESEENIDHLQNLQLGLMLSTLLILLLLVLLIFRPMVQRIRSKIKALKETEILLQESEQLHRLTLSNLSDAVFITDDKGAFTFICPNSQGIFGYSPEEVKEIRNIGPLFGGEPVDRSRLKDGEMLENSDWPVKDKEGIEHHLLISAKRVDIQGGTTLYSCRDITILKQAEEALRQSETRFRTIFERSPLSMQVISHDGRTLMVNKAWENLWGADLETLDNFNIFEDEQLRSKGITQYLERAFAGESVEIPAILFDPRESQPDLKRVQPHWVRALAFPMSEAGSPANKIVLQHEDINERKLMEMELASHRESLQKLVDERTGELVRANKKLRQEMRERHQAELAILDMARFTECNPAPVLKLGGDGKILLANDAAIELHDTDALVGKSWASLVDSAPDFEQLLKRSKPVQMECRCCNRTFLFTYQPIREQGVVYAYGTDITDLRSLEQQLLQSQKMEAVGQLAGGIAHDFNSLLGVILGYGDMMRDDIPPDIQLRENLEEIMQAGNRAKSLIRELMDFSRPNGNNRQQLQLAEAIRESVTMLRASLPATIRIHTSLHGGKEPVLANAGQISQVLMNLGINAGDAIGDRKGEIGIELARVKVDERLAAQHAVAVGPFLKLTVSDSGGGMEKETMARIFEPFFTTKGVGEGTGLGLAIVHGIVKGHSGFITVESTPGNGSSFHIYLPAMDK